MSDKELQEEDRPDGASERSVLQIETDKIGRVNVSGRAVEPFLAMSLIAIGPGVTVYASSTASFPTWATLVIVGVQVITALAMLVILTGRKPGRRQIGR